MLRQFMLVSAVGCMAFSAYGADCNKAKIEGIVKSACEVIGGKPDTALDGLKNDKFMGKDACDSYVTVWEVKPDGVFTKYNPSKPELEQKNTEQIYKDANGKEFGKIYKDCTKAKGNTCWVEYVWPKPGSKDPKVNPPVAKCVYRMNCDGKWTVGIGPYGTCKDLGLKAGEFK